MWRKPLRFCKRPLSCFGVTARVVPLIGTLQSVHLGEYSMPLTAYNNVPVPSFMYGTAWKKEATTQLVQLAVVAGFAAIDTANQLIHYQEALVGEALQALAKKGIKRDSLFLQTKFTSVDGQGGRTPYDPSADLTTQVSQSSDSS